MTGAGLPFTQEAFLEIFAAYNSLLWPAQFAGYGFGLAALFALWSQDVRFQRIACGSLAAMWLWTGLFYHLIFFVRINPAAWLFGLVFLIEGAMLVAAARRPEALRLHRRDDLRGWIGAGLIVYALVIYPVAAVLTGHLWPRMPTFGITPCPVTLFTIGLFLFGRVPLSLWIIPLLWSLVGGAAATMLEMREDWVLLLSGPLALLALAISSRRCNPEASGRA